MLLPVTGSATMQTYRFQDPKLNVDPGDITTPAPDPCPVGAKVRTYAVTSLSVPIVYNNWGDFDPIGRIYVRDAQVGPLLNEIVSALNNHKLPEGTVALPKVLDALNEAKTLHALGPSMRLQTAASLARLESAFQEDSAVAAEHWGPDSQHANLRPWLTSSR
jgi:hypothetical protein